MTKYSDCTVDCTGNVCLGDTVLFKEDVFGGSYRKPKYVGQRTILAKVVGCNYGQEKQQHTFTLCLIRCTGTSASDVRATQKRMGHIKRKARNVYRNSTKRVEWENENHRKVALEEKYERGSTARSERQQRKLYEQVI